jgi:hypothetical protein
MYGGFTVMQQDAIGTILAHGDFKVLDWYNGGPRTFDIPFALVSGGCTILVKAYTGDGFGNDWIRASGQGGPTASYTATITAL